MHLLNIKWHIININTNYDSFFSLKQNELEWNNKNCTLDYTANQNIALISQKSIVDWNWNPLHANKTYFIKSFTRLFLNAIKEKRLFRKISTENFSESYLIRPNWFITETWLILLFSSRIIWTTSFPHQLLAIIKQSIAEFKLSKTIFHFPKLNEFH